MAGRPNSKAVEVVNLDKSILNLTCSDLAQTLFKFYGSTGQLLRESTPIICGGSDSLSVSHCECEALQNGSWNQIASLAYCRLSSDSAQIDLPSGEEIMLVTGGDDGSSVLSGMEWYDGQEWQLGAEMPTKVYFHSMVKLNSCRVLMVGGYTGDYVLNMTYYYDANLNLWTPGPLLNTGRYSHACSILEMLNTSSGLVERLVVAVGGQGQDNSGLVSVEFLPFNDGWNNDPVWMYGPPLFCAVNSATMVEQSNSFVLGGGFGEVSGRNFYKLSSLQGPWIQRMNCQRKNTIAMLEF